MASTTRWSLLGLKREHVLLMILLLFFAALPGALIPLLPSELLPALLCGPFLVLLAALRPDVGVLFGFLFIYGIVPPAYVPSIALGGGTVKVHDLWIAFLAITVLFRVIKLKNKCPSAIAPFHIPLLFMFGLLLISIAYSTLYLSNAGAISEAREFILWALLPIIVFSLDSERKCNQFVAGLILLSVAISFLFLVQSMFNIAWMAETSIAPLSQREKEITRIFSGGVYLIIFSLIYLGILSVELPSRCIWTLPLLILFMGALSVTFGRAVWIATGLALVLSSFLSRGIRGIAAVTSLSVAAIFLLLAVLVIAKPTLVEALINRMGNVNNELDRGGTLRWRLLENQEAMNSIVARPILGVGIGGNYKKVATPATRFIIEQRYIHNGYLFFPVKFGVIGILFPLMMILLFVIEVLRVRTAGCRSPCLFSAVVGAFLVPVVTSLTQPEWSGGQGISAFCCFIALLCVLRNQAKQDRTRMAGTGE